MELIIVDHIRKLRYKLILRYLNLKQILLARI